MNLNKRKMGKNDLHNIFFNDDDLVKNIKSNCYDIAEQWVSAGRKENLKEWLDNKYIPMLQTMLPIFQQIVTDGINNDECEVVNK